MKIIINQLERNVADDIVITAHWTAIEEDSGHQVHLYGEQSFTRDEDSPELIPFADLTEEIVVSWLDLDGVEADLLAKIEEKKRDEGTPTASSYLDNPTSITGKPW